ncbi:MAG: hypothetical protein AABX04_01785 [Nanoarchaeota archaeon]
MSKFGIKVSALCLYVSTACIGMSAYTGVNTIYKLTSIPNIEYREPCITLQENFEFRNPPNLEKRVKRLVDKGFAYNKKSDPYNHRELEEYNVLYSKMSCGTALQQTNETDKILYWGIFMAVGYTVSSLFFSGASIDFVKEAKRRRDKLGIKKEDFKFHYMWRDAFNCIAERGYFKDDK